MIHRNSPRALKNFVVVDCAALPETLVESMLFGHEKGAFTGAERSRIGFIKEADGGTLFLDEVGELPMAVQKDFLRVLQEQRFRPIGSNREEKSDFRLISATNRNLEKMVESGHFRKDLFFRLQSGNIELPPLRMRPGDIRELLLHYMVRFCERYEMETKGISPEFLDALISYGWPGNVRELINAVESALAVARFEQTLYPYHLPMNIRVHLARASVGKKQSQELNQDENISQGRQLKALQEVRAAAIEKVEKQYLENLMVFTNGDMSESMSISGLSQSRLYHLLKKYNIKDH